jgi:hypothetical protein
MSQGYAQRAAIYFPLDSIGRVNFSRVVNHAELKIWADNADSANLTYSGVGILYKDGTMADSMWKVNADSARAGLVAITSTAFDSFNSVLTFDVTSTVAFWVVNPDSNAGFQVLTSEEGGHLTRQIFHSPLSEVIEKRPRLTLWLTAQE